MNSHLRKPYFTLWGKKKKKYEIYSVPVTNTKAKMNQYQSVQVLSLFNGEKCGLQKTSKGKFQAPNSGV